MYHVGDIYFLEAFHIIVEGNVGRCFGICVFKVLIICLRY